MKKFFGKIKDWFVRHKPSKRRLIQFYAALLYNANIKGFITGNIYTGSSKKMCVPGFNCYSCPGAVGACPLGSLQNALGASDTKAPFYVLGIIILFGLILGRAICGFLCPMGLIQDLLYKIKSFKLKKSKVTRILSYLKYVLLALMVVIIPLSYSSLGAKIPAFCKYVCPVGTVEGSLGLLSNPNNANFFEMLGPLFTWKFCVMVVVLVASIFVYRPFCRFLCPLGAIYGFFSKIALLGIKLDKQKCIDCGLCIDTCQVDIKHVGDHECIHCGKCVDVCPTKAISWKGGQFFLKPNEIEAASVDSVDLAANLPKISTSEQIAIVQSNETQIAEKTQNKKPKLYCFRKNNGFWTQVIAWILAGVVLVGALVYCNFIYQPPVGATDTYKVGDTFNGLVQRKYFSDDDATYDISDDLSDGKVVVLNFWYITCGGCEAEIPHFGELAKDKNYKDKVSVVVVHANDDDRLYGADDKVTLGGVEMPYLEKYVLDDKSKEGAPHKWSEFYDAITWTIDGSGNEWIYNALGGTTAYPMTAIIAPDGTIKFITLRAMTRESLYAEVDAILAELE